jgi:hypothetical protein
MDLHKLPYYDYEVKCLTLNHNFLLILFVSTQYEIGNQSHPTEAPLGGGKGIVTVIFHTNSTGMLAPLNGVIAAGIDNIQPNGESDTTLWRWESRIPLPSPTMPATTTAVSPTQ